MNNQIIKKGLIIGTATLISLSLAHTASATPAFSRQINADCRTCHVMGMHTLNKFGRMFKLNAFSLSDAMKAELKEKKAAKAKKNQEKQMQDQEQKVQS